MTCFIVRWDRNVKSDKIKSIWYLVFFDKLLHLAPPITTFNEIEKTPTPLQCLSQPGLFYRCHPFLYE